VLDSLGRDGFRFYAMWWDSALAWAWAPLMLVGWATLLSAKEASTQPDRTDTDDGDPGRSGPSSPVPTVSEAQEARRLRRSAPGAA
jgi:hypothetical protein